MKKSSIILVVLIITFSFSGCLKDDYEALQNKIIEAEAGIDETKDDIDDLEKEYKDLEHDQEEAKQKRKELLKTSQELTDEASLLNDKINDTSDDGLRITAIEFSQGFSSYQTETEFSLNIDIDDPPIMSIDDGILKFTYLCNYDYDIIVGFYYVLEMAPDNLHVKNIHFIADLTTAEEHPEQFLGYIAALGYAYAKAREGQYLEPLQDKYNLDLLFDGESAYNDSVILERNTDGDYFIVSLTDIS